MENRIRERRTERRWTQADLAAALDVSRQTVNALETGKYDPSLPLAFRIARLFGEPLESLFIDPDIGAGAAPGLAQGTGWEEQTRAATALTELNVLSEMGEQGWELTGFGVGFLNFRRPVGVPAQRWTYQRLSGLLHAETQADMARSGWAYVGSWLGQVFHYFKRPLA